jgi:UDP-N-acetylglucosamine 3-dehydrogenase
MARIGIGVIGCGDIAHVRYLPSIAASPEARLIGVYSRRRATCETATRQFGGKAYHDLEALLSDSEVDAVIVATPHPSHAELAIRALDAGKHVLTEKPMATSLADADRVLEAASRTRNVLMALPLDSSPPPSMKQDGLSEQVRLAASVGPMRSSRIMDHCTRRGSSMRSRPAGESSPISAST